MAEKRSSMTGKTGKEEEKKKRKVEERVKESDRGEG